jgi:hypothetical protein
VTDAQQRLLNQARRWAREVPKESAPAQKRRAANKCLHCLKQLLGGEPKFELTRQ